MQLIVITPEYFFGDEAAFLNELFHCGLSVLHLRKPDSTKKELSFLIRQINAGYLDRVVLHDHFELMNDFQLKGIHLNKRNPYPPQAGNFSISYSCHTLNEIETLKNYNYAFLSPIFDSISKRGYSKSFTGEELRDAKKKGIINEKIIALGGITPEHLSDINNLGFGGVAVLGYLWKDVEKRNEIPIFMKRFNELKKICDKL